MGDHTIVIEIDENQHEDYECSCENKRLMELFQDAGGNRPFTMIRFNPDEYFTLDGKCKGSCFGYTKEKGLCIVKNEKKTEWKQRLDTLRKHIDFVINDVKERKEIDVIHLYYDGYVQ